MQIRRISSQGPEPLEQFYSQLADDPTTSSTGKLMLSLLGRLQSEGPDVVVWAMTSQTDLVLLLKDDARSRSFANIQARTRWYFIECAMSERFQPWPDAWVKGRADDAQQASRMLHIALGWCGTSSR